MLAGGDIIVVREESFPGEDRIEVVGSVDAGITAARWSPDEELLAITTKADTVVFMSRSFEGITDVTMTAEDLKASNHVSVGWGKKETQFKGKGAKALRDPTMPEKTDEGVLSPHDDSTASISWRGDGAYLAISTIEAGVRRMIRVYSREGVLDSVSEPVDGLEGALSWRPAGNLIAGIQRFDQRVDVVFFERNGLRHGQFSLRLTEEQLNVKQHIGLSWNSDSTVLAVVMADSVQLWTMGNYHWYLKQEIPRKNTALLHYNSLVWHPEKPLQLLTSASGEFKKSSMIEFGSNKPGSVSVSDYIFTTARGSTIPPHDHGVVAVIDGQTIKVTPLRDANIPPPMSLHEISVPSNVIDVSFNTDASQIAVLHQEGISVLEWKRITASSTAPDLTGRYTFERTELAESTYQQICFADEGEIITLQRKGQKSHIATYYFSNDTGRMEMKSLENDPATSLATISSFSTESSIQTFAQDLSGNLHSLAPHGQSLTQNGFPILLPWVEVTSFNNSPIAFGLCSNGHLYANSRLLIKNCTSFLLTSAHLIFTTTTHLIKFVHITEVNGTTLRSRVWAS